MMNICAIMCAYRAEHMKSDVLGNILCSGERSGGYRQDGDVEIGKLEDRLLGDD